MRNNRKKQLVLQEEAAKQNLLNLPQRHKKNIENILSLNAWLQHHTFKCAALSFAGGVKAGKVLKAYQNSELVKSNLDNHNQMKYQESNKKKPKKLAAYFLNTGSGFLISFLKKTFITALTASIVTNNDSPEAVIQPSQKPDFTAL